jgi:hypothetical protein
MPHHLCSRLGIRLSTYLRQAYLLPLMVCAPAAVVFVLMQKWFVAHTYRQLIPQLLAGGLVYGICLGWAYMTDRVLHVGDLTPPAERLTSEFPTMPIAAESRREEI